MEYKIIDDKPVMTVKQFEKVSKGLPIFFVNQLRENICVIETDLEKARRILSSKEADTNERMIMTSEDYIFLRNLISKVEEI